ncbi:hypothetical protein [Acetobacteroides hydrogenigenes]|uniref:Uncharacterized protein n=1 Tax=Acetobacteroides hydrogenigenes TaxID=979970 RepID=A0A4R2E9I6_9BACT|nr:hypothetical protein [Acetobacteroides hydrogenigenes]TCN65348.1 hypothetical protein CLV25_11127 [Acetobacteroides hydrogenigenes]
MAKQEGLIKLKGKIGDFSFYKSKDGHLARMKGGVDAERIKNDPAFERTRENGAEFGRAGKAGKLLRDALRNFIRNGSDSRMTSRLTGEMMRVVKADATSTRGQRNVLDGELELLEGFEFNSNAKLGTSYFRKMASTIDRAEGKATVSFGVITPNADFGAPEGATHVKLVSGVAKVDFEAGTFEVSEAQPYQVSLAAAEPTKDAVSLSSTFAKAETKPLFLVLGIEFYQQVNGELYSLKNGQYNSVSLVKVSGLAQPQP